MLLNDCESIGLGIEAFSQSGQMVSTKVNCQTDRTKLWRLHNRGNVELGVGSVWLSWEIEGNWSTRQDWYKPGSRLQNKTDHQRRPSGRGTQARRSVLTIGHMTGGQEGSEIGEIPILSELKTLKVSVIVNLRKCWSPLKAFLSCIGFVCRVLN